MADLLVELLGGLRVATAGGPDIRIPSRKAQALLACLALKPGAPLGRDFLAGLLWDDSDPELARSSLRQALAALRRALPPGSAGALVTDANSVSLDSSRVASDVVAFQALVRDGSPASVATAAERHAGLFLAGFDARSAAFEQWAEDHRRTLRRELVHAMERAAAHCSTAGDTAGVVDVLTRLVAIEPANERAHRELMDAFARLGRHTDALRQYRSCRDVLRRDLDVAPEPATDALYRDILKRRRAVQPDAGAGDEDSGGATDAAEVADAGTGATAGAAMSTTGTAGAKPTDRPNAAPVTTLREAVVLVARIGSPAGRSRDDPESLLELWSTEELRLRELVERFGGVADRPSQGETATVFGLGITTGNELERAARVALQLAGRSNGSQGDPGIDHRRVPRYAVAIARGQVLPSAGGLAFPLAGRPVTQAQVLVRSAVPGTVLVTEEVATQLGERYHLLPAPAGSPERSIELQGQRETSAEVWAARFVGRRAELAMLAALLERVIDARRGRTVVVRGDPGIGKSSLIRALAVAAGERGVAVHTVQALDFGQSAAERPVPALAARLLGIAPEAADDARQAAISRAVAAGVLAATDELPALDLLGVSLSRESASLLATMEPAARERARARVLNRLLGRVAAAGPLLAVVEDVHWADIVEMGHLGDLAAAAAGLAVLLVLSTRADGDPVSAAWRARARGCPVTTLDLSPLDDDEARELAARFAGLSADVVERCLEAAAGHPLFLEQLLRSAHPGVDALPGSVRALLLARVDRLPVECQRVLQAAATLGTRFPLGALRHVLADPGCNVSLLEQAGLLAMDGEECRFAHALIRSAVYESLLRSTRRELHRRAAAWYESRDPGLHADHLGAAEDPGAAAAYLAAARESLRAFRLARALALVERARELARGAHDLFDAIATRGDVLLAKGRTDDAIAAYREALELATDRDARARARLGLATGLRIVDRYDEALAVVECAERSAAEDADPQRLAKLWTLRGNLHFPRGEIEACLQAHQRALEYAEAAESTEDIVRALGGLGDAHYQRGRMRTAQGLFRRCVELCDEHGMAGPRLTYLSMVAATGCFTCEFADALGTCARVEAAAQAIGDLRSELLAVAIQAAVEIYRANYGTAAERSVRGLAISRELGARRFEAETLTLRGLSLSGLGRRAEALETLRSAATLARGAAPTYCGPLALGALATVEDDRERRLALIEEGEALLARGCVSHNHLEFRWHAIEVCLADGDRAGALRHAAALEDYTREEPLPWAGHVAAWARALATGEVMDEARDAARRVEFNALL